MLVLNGLFKFEQLAEWTICVVISSSPDRDRIEIIESNACGSLLLEGSNNVVKEKAAGIIQPLLHLMRRASACPFG